MALADHVVVMNHGRIEDEGSPERVYGRPATRFAATFMGESTVVAGSIDKGLIRTALGSFAAPDGATHVAIRPEHVTLGGSLAARVTDVVYQGSFKRVTADLAGEPEISLLARWPAETAVRVGDDIKMGLEASHVIILAR